MNNMNDQDRDPPDPLFDALRADLAKLDAPRGVEKELMQAFARQFPQQRWYRKLAGRRWGLAAGLAAACMAAVTFGLVLHAPRPGGDAGASGAMVSRQAPQGGGLFIALESPERIEREPAPRMVETQVSRSSLAPLGVPLTPENAGDIVKAEMLLAADGRPLALRLTSID